ncbi:MAG: hypothetical protein ACXVA9_01425 [Bdellovibrionales bacterium]
MAVFFHGNRSIAYQSHFAPFAHDLLLLQSSRFNTDFWGPVLEKFDQEPKASGRIITCEWFDAKLDTATMAEDLNNLLQTLGLHTLHVVACDDAVKVITELEKKYPGSVDKTLLFPQSLSRNEELARSVHEFSRI